MSTGNDLRGDYLALRGKDACLAWRNRFGNGVSEKLLQEFPQQLVPLVLPSGACGERQLGVLLPLGDFVQDAQRVAKQCLAVFFTGEGTIGGKQCLTVGDREAGSEDRPSEALLLVPGESGERVGETDREPSLVDCRVERPTQAFKQSVPLAGPGALTPQEFGCGGQGESVVANQGGDDPCLVHGCDGLPRGIGLQEQRLRVASRFLKDDGQLACAGVLGSAEPLEAVDHLIAPWLLRRGDDAKGKLGQAIVACGHGGAKGRVGRSELRRGNERNGISHSYSFSPASNERIW